MISFILYIDLEQFLAEKTLSNTSAWSQVLSTGIAQIKKKTWQGQGAWTRCITNLCTTHRNTSKGFLHHHRKHTVETQPCTTRKNGHANTSVWASHWLVALRTWYRHRINATLICFFLILPHPPRAALDV